MKKLNVILMLSMSVLLLFGCSSDTEEEMTEEEVVEVATLQETFGEYFDVGVALSTKTYETYDISLYQEFGTIVCENEMKWENIQNQEGVFTFDSADKIAEFARENGFEMRGHTLVWHSQTPTWVCTVPADATVDEAIEIVLERVETQFVALNERYGDVIFAWDVANEVISDSSDPNEIYRQDSIYYQMCGSDDAKFEYFISEVFKMVESINPDVICYYNDYNLEWNQVKRDKTITFIENVEAYGAEVDGIGLQSHNDISMTKETYASAISDFEESGLFTELSVTELDISVYTSDSQTEMVVLDEATAQTQAEVYADLFELFREKSDFVANVTFWGISDLSSWKDNYPVVGRNDHPLLFDDNGKAKLAYDAIMNFE